ncbi:MAG TPA: invasin domain 3-containing protein [Luteolibacter sp.]|nr:invasin domain 3-containing protein [Luteolibacter sp.]
MKKNLVAPIAILSLAAALPSQAVNIDVADFSLTPDGGTTVGVQNTNINTPNGGTVLPASGTPVVYVVSTFTFGTDSDAHLQWQFYVNETTAPRLGVEIQDTGLVQFLGSGDTTRTNFNFNQDMAGQTVTLLAKLSYDANNNVTYEKSGASDDTILNVWINPTGSSVEGSGLSAGDMSTIWNSAGFNWFRQIIQNQSTPGTSGDSSITDTWVLTGANATFANALALAQGGTPPPPGDVDANISTVSASPAFVPADGATTSTITVTLLDSLGDPVPNKDVTLAGSPGNAVIDPLSAVTTDASGQATFTVTSSTAGDEEFTATNTTDSQVIPQTASVTFVGAADAGLSTVSASPIHVPADGTSTSTITVTVLASGNIPLQGKDVTLANTAGPQAAVIDPVGAVTTDASGVATFTVSSSTSGGEEFTATVTTDSLEITQTATVNFVGPSDAGNSTVVASPSAVVADGVATSTITVSLKDANGFPVEGNDVTLANTAGPQAAVIDPLTPVTTDANGVATFSVSSNTLGTEVFTATDTTDSVAITQTASVDFLDPAIPYAINVSFSGFTNVNPANTIEVESELVGPAGGLGTRWNQFAANSSSGTLLDPTGIGTGVSFTTDFSEGRYDGTGATPMLRSTLTDFAKANTAPTRTFTITGLVPDAAYDVWLTAFRNQGSAAERIYGRWIANNSTTSAGTQFIDNRDGQNGTTFVEGYNYVVFTSVVADGSGQISFVGDAMGIEEGADADYRQGLSGFQIAPAAGPPPPTTSLVIDLGTSPTGTTILGGQYIGSGPTNLPIPELPVGSILRSIEMDVALEATDNQNFASDLAVLLDPTPEAPGGDFSVEITNGTSPFGATVSLGWSSGDAGPVTPLTDTKTAADWAAVSPIDLATTGLFLGNAFGSAPEGGTWSGTITLTYDVVSPATEYGTWSGGELFGDDKNGDGVDNGIAFLLGADNPDDNANGLLPAAGNDGSGLVIEFSMLNADNRGDAALTLQWSNDLGVTDLWENNEAVVPDVSGTVNGVEFVITPGDPTNAVEATIPSTEGTGGKLFGRLSGSEN